MLCEVNLVPTCITLDGKINLMLVRANSKNCFMIHVGHMEFASTTSRIALHPTKIEYQTQLKVMTVIHTIMHNILECSSCKRLPVKSFHLVEPNFSQQNAAFYRLYENFENNYLWKANWISSDRMQYFKEGQSSDSVVIKLLRLRFIMM